MQIMEGKFLQERSDKVTKEEWFTQLFDHLEHSKFRSSFHLKQRDIDYINEKGMDTIRAHARDFIEKREAPAYIPNDGKQTPMKGHHVPGDTCKSAVWEHSLE